MITGSIGGCSVITGSIGGCSVITGSIGGCSVITGSIGGCSVITGSIGGSLRQVSGTATGKRVLLSPSAIREAIFPDYSGFSISPV